MAASADPPAREANTREPTPWIIGPVAFSRDPTADGALYRRLVFPTLGVPCPFFSTGQSKPSANRFHSIGSIIA